METPPNTSYSGLMANAKADEIKCIYFVQREEEASNILCAKSSTRIAQSQNWFKWNEMKNDTKREKRDIETRHPKNICMRTHVAKCHFGICIFANNADKNWQRSMSRKEEEEKERGARDGSGSLVFFWHCVHCKLYIEPLFRFDRFSLSLFILFPFLWLEGFLCVCVRVCTSTFVNSILCSEIRIRIPALK